MELPEGLMAVRKIGRHGFIGLVSVHGEESDIVNSARISTQKGKSFNDKAERTAADDISLLNYLYRNKHSSPFEMVGVRFVMDVPIFVLRQWHRHRTWSYNEVSGRYTSLEEHPVFMPEVFNNTPHRRTQGRGKAMDERDQIRVSEIYKMATETSLMAYKKLVDAGVSLEQARILLPLGVYTRCFAKTDLNNFLKFCTLRVAKDAQKEIYEYAKAALSMVREHFPNVVSAWEAERKKSSYSIKQQRALVSYFDGVDLTKESANLRMTVRNLKKNVRKHDNLSNREEAQGS